MYKIKTEKSKEIKKKYKLINIAKEVGISISHTSLILNGKKYSTKPVAYCITKFIDNDAEIEDYFDRI